MKVKKNNTITVIMTPDEVSNALFDWADRNMESVGESHIPKGDYTVNWKSYLELGQRKGVSVLLTIIPKGSSK